MTDLLVVCSPGGHFFEARGLVTGMNDIDFKYVVHFPPAAPKNLDDCVIVAPHAERDLRVILQFIFALWCVWKEQPKVVLSTGALIAVTFGLAAKLFGSRFIFVESPTRVSTPSLSARICCRFADVTYVRDPQLLAKLRRAQCPNEVK